MPDVVAAPIRSPRRAGAAWRALPLLAVALAVAGPSVAVPLASCAPLEGGAGQPPGCDWSSPVTEGGRGSFAAGLRAVAAPATASAAGAEPAGPGEAPVGGLVALASVAAVLSLSLRRASA